MSKEKIIEITCKDKPEAINGGSPNSLSGLSSVLSDPLYGASPNMIKQLHRTFYNAKPERLKTKTGMVIITGTKGNDYE